MKFVKLIKAKEKEFYFVFMNGEKISPAFDLLEDARNWAETNFSIDDDRISIEKDYED